MGLFGKLFGPPSQKKFARLLVERLRRAGETGVVQINDVEFTLDGPGDRRFFLHNAYAEFCRADKLQREAFLARFVQTWSTSQHGIPEDFEDVRSDLMPALRARSYFEVDAKLGLGGRAEDFDIPYQIVADTLAAGLVYDLPTSMATINQEQLDTWGVTFYEAMEIALQNLRETTNTCAQIGAAYAVVHGDGYDATRLLLTDLVEKLDVQGDPVAMVPNRESLIIAGSDDAEGLGLLLKLAQDGVQNERFVSGIAFRLTGDEWRPWLPPEDHPLFGEFNLMRIKTIGSDYESQKALLDAKHQKTGKDVYVASFSALQGPSGKAESYSVWTQGVNTLLPRTDLMLLAAPGPDGKPALAAKAPWETVERIVGHLLQPQDLYPPRWLVESFPSGNELKQIGGAE